VLDARAQRRVRAQEVRRPTEVRHELRHARRRHHTGQAMAVPKTCAARDPLEGRRRAVEALRQTQLALFGRAVVPELDRAREVGIAPTEEHDDRREHVAREDGEGHRRGEPGGRGRVGPHETRALERAEHDGLTGRPSLAGEARIVRETQRPAGLTELDEIAVRALPELERGAIARRYPDFGDANEGLHRRDALGPSWPNRTIARWRACSPSESCGARDTKAA
jgi:hypothetical protein